MGLNVILLGPPGAGKGTQAEILGGKYRIPHISTGDMLREAIRNGSPRGLEAKAYMERGELVPDALVIAMVKERLERPDARTGFLLDGFPRTTEQARDLDAMLRGIGKAVDVVLYFTASKALILKRLTGRRVCRACGKIYNIPNSQPRCEGICDVCEGEIYQRADDREETVAKRLEVYEAQTAALVDYYRSSGVLKEVSGDKDARALTRDIDAIFGGAARVR
jgi:adenylate kinase